MATRRRRAAKPRAAAPVVDQKAVLAQVQSIFGLTDAMLSLDKTDPAKGFTLKEAFEQIRTQKITDPARAAQILAKTNWFRTNGPEVTKRLVAEKSGSGDFKQSLTAQTAELRDAMAAKGINLAPADLNALARDAYVYGLNGSQILDRAAASGTFTGGGEVGGAVADLDTLAYNNGVKISGTERNAWQRDIASGNKTPKDYEAMIRENAAQTYTPFAEQLRAGQNLSDLVRPYKQVANDLLEQGDIGWDDPLFRDGKGFQTVSADGKPAVKPLWEFRKDVMKDSRYQYTDGARTAATDFGAQILKRFGVVN